MDTCPDCGTLVYGGERSCQVCGTALSDDTTDASREEPTDEGAERVDPMGTLATALWAVLWVVTTPTLLVLAVLAGAGAFLATLVVPGPPAILATVVLATVPMAVTFRYASAWEAAEQADEREADGRQSATNGREAIRDVHGTTAENSGAAVDDSVSAVDDSKTVTNDSDAKANDGAIVAAAIRRLPALLVAVVVFAAGAWAVWFVSAFVLFQPLGSIVGVLFVAYFLAQLSLGFAAVVDGDGPVEGVTAGYLLSDGVELKLLGQFLLFAGVGIAFTVLVGGTPLVRFGVAVVSMVLVTMLGAAVGRIYLEQRAIQ